MSRMSVVRRWINARCDSLIPDLQRAESSRQLQELADADGDWFAEWSSGLLSDLIYTLDPADPWRNTELDDQGTVRLPDGSVFGTYHNAGDVHAYTTVDDPHEDIGLAALADGLEVEAARLWTAAQEGLEPALRCFPRMPPGSAYGLSDSALRWALFRRRAFMGADDTYALVAAGHWAQRADRIIQGKPWDESGAARLREGARVEPGTYDLLTS